jgi:hypothetical protein
LLASVLHFYSGQPLQNLSGVDRRSLDSIDPIDQRGDEAQSGEEISTGFVIADYNCSKILQAAERSFDDIAQTIKVGVEWEEPLAVDLVRNDRRRAASLQDEAQMIRVVT